MYGPPINPKVNTKYQTSVNVSHDYTQVNIETIA